MNYTNFDNIKVNSDRSSSGTRSNRQWTHGYHRYPAEFLPDVVKKLIEQYADKNGKIADVFAGCGTTLVEAKAHGIASIGIDVNPVALLITKAKTNPIEQNVLQEAYIHLIAIFSNYNSSSSQNIQKHERIDYWFRPEEKEKISYIYESITEIKNEDIKNFFLVCLSHILKNCSRWLMSGTKPQIDPQKTPSEPFETFKQHCKIMMNQNAQFYNELMDKQFLDIGCDIELSDARKTNIPDGSITTIITSPPYVTSYEYADIHQLTGYWFEYFSDLREFRKNFIGTFYSNNQNCSPDSRIGKKIIEKLHNIDERTACEVSNYFSDMELVGKEMYRIVKDNGYVCAVIGNTMLKNIKVKSAEVFYEILETVGFEKVDIIKRSIPNKLMPTIRDKNSGRFTKLSNPNSKLVYPDEFIIVVKKK